MIICLFPEKKPDRGQAGRRLRSNQIWLAFDRIVVLKGVPQPSIFDPQCTLEEPIVTFLECDRLVLPSTVYAFNSVVVAFSATEVNDSLIRFRFALTGGTDNDTFWTELEIIARAFSVSPPVSL